MNPNTGEATAEGDVKTTDVEQMKPPGKTDASRATHVTADNLTLHKDPTVAVYSGNVRLWGDLGRLEAPSVEFRKNPRQVIAQMSGSKTVTATLIQMDKNGRSIPVLISADQLIYDDEEHVARFEGRVSAKREAVTLQAKKMSCYLSKNRISGKDATSSGSLEKIIAQGDVVVGDASRRATGQQLVYTALDDKFVMTGGFPSIFDAEHGKITGNSLTLFGHDDRVLVEGNERSPSVTDTRVAR